MGHVAGAVQASQRHLERLTMRRALGLALLLALLVGGPSRAAAQSIWDDPAFQLVRQATEALNEGNFAKAGELATRATVELPSHPLAYYVRGQAAAAQSRWDEAAQSFAKVVELYPRSFAAHRDLGASLERLNKTKEAAQAYKAALALRDQEDLRVRMALMLVEAGDQAAALADLEKLAAAGTKEVGVWTTLGRLSYEKGEIPAAEKAYAKAVELKDNGRNWFNLGVVRARLKDYPGALKALERAAQHQDVKKQAETEAGRIRETMRGDSGPARQGRPPGQYSVPTGPSSR
jgi:tetratricopeptide (TPR) repeat protein